jgi:hypothetical protein
MSHGRWIRWRPSTGPCPLPQRSRGKVVLVNEDIFDPGLSPRPDPLLPVGPRYIFPTRHPAALGAAMQGEAPPRCIPGLIVETQADIDDVERVRALVQIRAPYRALVVSPLERVDLALFGNAPSAWGLGYHPFHELFRLVLVRGPQIGAVAPAIVRDLRDQAADAGLAFTFMSWSDAAATPPLLDGRAHDAVPWETYR